MLYFAIVTYTVVQRYRVELMVESAAGVRCRDFASDLPFSIIRFRHSCFGKNVESLVKGSLRRGESGKNDGVRKQ